MGRKSRCDYSGEDLGRMVPVKRFGELRWYGGCQFSRDRLNGLLNISQKTFAGSLVEKFGVADVKSIPMPIGIHLEEFSRDEPVETWPFRELIGSVMWLATQTRLDISNAVRAVARYCAGPREIRWNTALLIGILAYKKVKTGHGITSREVWIDGLLMQVLPDADYVSKAN